MMLTDNQRLSMYRQFPEALAEEVACVFRPLENDEQRIRHNAALERFFGLIPTGTAEKMVYKNVARAIIASANQERQTDGTSDHTEET